MALYTPTAQSTGRFELQGVQSVFDNCSDIIEEPVVGDDFYDPNTGKVSQLIGQTRYQNLTLTGLLSRVQFLQLKALKDSPKSRDGSLTGTHVIGEGTNTVTTIVTGVRIMRFQYGTFDKLSNSPAKVQVELSFTGTRVT
jgi:hypothetical protein